MSIGKIVDFDIQTGNWTAYVERLEMYFLANNIKDNVKLPTLISVMGDSAYELLSTLANPKKPSELTYIEAVELLRHHLQPKPSPLAERYKFRQRRQTDNESISDYVAVLKKLCKNCDFGSTLEDNIRDQLVCGIRSDVIRQRLFAEEKLITYEKAVTLAGSLEAAERDASLVDSGKYSSELTNNAVGGTSGLHTMGSFISQRGGNRTRPATTNARPGGGMVPRIIDICGSCGGRDHLANNCKFISYVCSKCGTTGHLRRVCPMERLTSGSGGREHRQRQQRGITRDRRGSRYNNIGAGGVRNTNFIGNA
ncbi:uncharacterized protein LOC131844146 [Achroia grisella]|uniref:uncharacterized protein LOC131844146 n=1 Tax=Achroia grisella TaxID=688607 RepID=UPI0027D2DA94|nr:uncharacterized protein LOC131844146 [Achroia grisella]